MQVLLLALDKHREVPGCYDFDLNIIRFKMVNPRSFVLQTEEQVTGKLCTELERCAKQALAKGDVFRIGVSGGSLVQLLTKALTVAQLDLARLRIFFCDERHVPDNDTESTFGAYKVHMLPKLPTLSEQQFVKVNVSKSLEACAIDYEARLKAEFGNDSPKFDLLLLGMGPDGHTCSLFPGQKAALGENVRLIIPIRDSPKPPSERITFTLPLINNASEIIFVLTGANKADAVKRAFVESDAVLPSALVRPTNGQLTLIMDTGAGAVFQNGN